MSLRLLAVLCAGLVTADFGAGQQPGQQPAQQPSQKPTRQPEPEPEPEPAPKTRVLLIGDHGLSTHFGKVAAGLGAEFDVRRSSLGHLATAAGLRRIDELLEGGGWSVICFNFGLSDLMYRDPRSRAIRAMSPAVGGVRVTPLDSYSTNLEALVGKLRAQGARLVWCSTPPLEPRRRSSVLDDASVEAYNAAAAAVMERLDVAVFDTHGHVISLLEEAENPRARERLHGQLFKRDLSAPVVEAIRARLQPPVAPGADERRGPVRAEPSADSGRKTLAR